MTHTDDTQPTTTPTTPTDDAQPTTHRTHRPPTTRPVNIERMRRPRPRSRVGVTPQPYRKVRRRRFLHGARVRRMISLAIVILIAIAGLAQSHAEAELMALVGKISVEWMVGSTAMVIIEGIIHIVTGGE